MYSPNCWNFVLAGAFVFSLAAAAAAPERVATGEGSDATMVAAAAATARVECFSLLFSLVGWIRRGSDDLAIILG